MTQWRKSSRSNATGGECVEVANLAGQIGVRDSKNPAAPALLVPPAAFAATLHRIRHSNSAGSTVESF